MVRLLPSAVSAAGCPALFVGFVGTTNLSDFPESFIIGVRPYDLPDTAVLAHLRARRPWDLPVLAHGVSAHVEGLRPRGIRRRLALTSSPVLPSAPLNCVGIPICLVSWLNTSPAHAPVNASAAPSRASPHDSGSGCLATTFLCNSFICYSVPVYPGALSVRRNAKAVRDAAAGRTRATRTRLRWPARVRTAVPSCGAAAPRRGWRDASRP